MILRDLVSWHAANFVSNVVVTLLVTLLVCSKSPTGITFLFVQTGERWDLQNMPNELMDKIKVQNNLYRELEI